YDMNKKGGWGSKKTQRDEVTDVKAVGSEITSGGGTSLVSGGDQLYQGAKIEAGGDLAIISGGAVTFEAVKDMHQESHEKSKGDLAWNSAKGKGTTDETLRQNQLVAQGVMTIKAVDGLKIDIKHIDQATVSQSIDAMVKADPKLAWLKEAELRGDVDWRRVKEVHDSFKYDQSGLGTGASLVIAIIVTYLTWGAGASLVGAAGNSTIGFAANSVVSAAATNAATSTINNRGNLGAVVKDVTSSDAMKGYVMSALTPGGGSIVSRIALKAALSTVVYGGSLKDNAVQAGLEIAADALSGAIFNEVGDRLMGSGLPKRVAVHAIVGGLIAEAAGGDFRTAALAAGANEALVQLVGDKIFPGEAHDRVLGMTSQLVGMTVAAGLGADAKDQQVAGWVAQQATENNFLRHKEVEAFLAELKTCEANNSCAEVRKRYGELNAENQERLQSLCARDMAACHDEYKLFSDDYQKTHKLLAESMKDVGWRDKYNLGATILSNYQAMQTLVGTAMTKAMTDAAMEAAGQAGVEVDAEDVGTFGMWLRTVVKAVTNRKGAVGGTERGGSAINKETPKLDPPLALPSARPGIVIRGALEDHEFKQASEIVAFRGGEFKGAEGKSFAGIDGWLDGVPVQLKVVEGTSINAVRRNIISGAKDMSKAGYKGDMYVDASKTGVSMEKMIDHFRPGSPVSNVVGEGTVSNVYIKTQDGWLNVSAGRVSQHKGWQ
ncbi:DUF637 domain-containing protein, partial [Pseudomonas mosselii]